MKFRATLLAAAVVAVAAPAQAESVNIGVPNWVGAKAIANLIKVVVETKMGGTTDMVPGTNASIFAGMDRGKGEIDIHPDVWLPNQETFTNEYVKKKKTVVLSKNPYVGRQGFCVSKDFSKKHKVTSIFDLTRPDVAKAMDSDGNGKGEIWIGAPGWASANVNEIKVRDYGLMAFIEPIRAEQSVMTARVGDSIKKKQGYAFYCYSPHAIWNMYDIVRLEEPKFDPKKYIMVQPKQSADWKKKSKVMTEDALKAVQVAWSKSLEKRSPTIAAFLRNMKLDSDTVSNLVFQIAAKRRKPEEVAREWVAKNGKRVDGWLGL
ncbi:MAG: glycine/betaine ABC transporter substrate-binding protein [Rhodospirillaceae bacterium]|nr:glycine/betaine ABC transporter substrate-binding protein [Rhodospirillaceae bacterium]